MWFLVHSFPNDSPNAVSQHPLQNQSEFQRPYANWVGAEALWESLGRLNKQFLFTEQG